MIIVSFAFHLAAAASAVVAVALLLRGEGSPSRSKTERDALYVAVGFQTVAVALRWVDTGHPPVFGTFENTMACVWSLLVLALVLRSLPSRPGIRWEVAAILSWVPITALYGLFFNRTPYPLTISERSILVDIHVAFAWSGYAVLLWACMMALRVVLGGRDDSEDALTDRALLFAAGLGFVLFTGLLGVGAIYSFQLFTRFFTWELVETLSVALWLAYALVIHQRLFFGWRGRRLAWIMLSTLPLLLATFWAWSIFSGTYHHFEITEFRAW